MAEVEVGGVKVAGGKGLAVIMALGSLIGALYGGFEVYKDYTDLKQKLADLEPEGIQAQIDQAMIKLEEGVTYARDIRGDLKQDVIQVERSLSLVQKQMRDLDQDNRQAIQTAQKWFDERTEIVGRNQREMEDRLQKQIKQALSNALAEDR